MIVNAGKREGCGENMILKLLCQRVLKPQSKKMFGEFFDKIADGKSKCQIRATGMHFRFGHT